MRINVTSTLMPDEQGGWGASVSLQLIEHLVEHVEKCERLQKAAVSDGVPFAEIEPRCTARTSTSTAATTPSPASATRDMRIPCWLRGGLERCPAHARGRPDDTVTPSTSKSGWAWERKADTCHEIVFLSRSADGPTVLLYPPPPPREQLCNRYCSNKHTLYPLQY